MTSEKRKNIILACIIILLSITLMISRKSSDEEIRQLTEKIASQTDSLHKLSRTYDSIYIRYEYSSERLSLIIGEFEDYHKGIDSIMNKNIRNTQRIISIIKEYNDSHLIYFKEDTTVNCFRL